MLYFNQNKGNCTGCSACYSACPVHCITMNSDEEGFSYPEASDACIHCGLCEQVCPAFQPKKSNSFEQKAIAAVSKSYDIWHRSTSGGAFSEICRFFADKDTLIVGAAWDGLSVHHVGVWGFEAIMPLCKSKYISSYIDDTFIDIRNTLQAGKKALFCGCPCQVAGLKAFLRKEYDNLLTIDLICHGQGSPDVFKECIKLMSDDFGDIKHYQFRAKKKYYEQDYLSYVEATKTSAYIVNDAYMQLFFSQNALRPSCGKNCKYRNSNRPGDFTIADLKGLTELFPELAYTKKNWSTVVCNTEKGYSIFINLTQTMEVRPITIAEIIKYNPLFARQTWFSKDRDAFFADFSQNHIEAIKKWTKPCRLYKSNILNTIVISLPDICKQHLRIILKLLKKNTNK